MINISAGPGRDIEAIAAAGGTSVLDVHSDTYHGRSVLTMAGPDDDTLFGKVQAVSTEAIGRLDLRTHHGVHPRLGVVDVVPWVDLDDPWQPATPRSIDARDRYQRWAESTLHVPCLVYGPERSLPELRKTSRETSPKTSPKTTTKGRTDLTASGVICVGARGVMVAYNLYVDATLKTAAEAAKAIRSPTIRALAFQVGDEVQVSCNLIAPDVTGPEAVAQAVTRHAQVTRTEVVGLLPEDLPIRR